MYDNLIGLRFRNLYAGAVILPTKGDPGLYSALRISSPTSFAELSTWYFDQEDEKGALWVAVGGEHPEPVGVWLEYARQNLANCDVRCVSVIACVLDNSGAIPSDTACACSFTIRRTALDAEQVRTLASANQFTLFLPHRDEFLVIAEEGPNWRGLRALENPIVRMIALNLVHDTEGRPRPSGDGAYDPIVSQVNEVIGAVTGEARRAVAELIEEWKLAWPDRPVPDDMERRPSDIDEEHRRIKALVKSRHAQDDTHDLLWQIDRYAHTLRETRRTAVATRRKLREYQWTSDTPADYSSMAMPMMLRAIERYAVDVAERFGLTGHVFLPGFGDEFGMNARLFQSFQRPRRVPGSATVLLELPGEVRMRLGAFPMVAREIARKKESRVTQIARCIAQLENRGNPDARSMMPRNDDDPALALGVGEYLAADLLATAVIGPQYVYAMARFAVGNLAETTEAGMPEENRPMFPVRLKACLALLRALGREGIQFESIYLPDPFMHMPDEIVDIVRNEIDPIGYPDTEAIDAIADGLRQGEVVDGRPTLILAALWRAVAARSGFLNEVSALVSIARWH